MTTITTRADIFKRDRVRPNLYVTMHERAKHFTVRLENLMDRDVLALSSECRISSGCI